MQLKLSALGLITDAYPEFGDQRKNDVGEGIEHFGYVDGRSQPIFIAADAARENDGVSIWDPSASVDLVLVDDPLSPGAHGSYFVFRKLEENVKQFKLAEQELADALGLVGDAREVAGAMVIGRFEDGTPVELSDKPLIEDLAATPKIKHGSVPNNFDYEADPAGNRCPIHAHIRKTNPRGSLGSAFKTAVLPGGDPVAFSKAVQMARRGMTYGERKDDGSVIDNMPEAGVGLLFMSYQANIANQFRVMQKLWANSDVFPDHVPGPPAPPIANLIDPVIGQPPGAHSPNAKWPVTWNDPAAGRQPFSFKLFVTMKGGEYFYAPSLPGLAAL
jgi:Dyp-type peroxidase family